MKLLLIATTQLQGTTTDYKIKRQAKSLGTVDQLICSDQKLLKQD